MKNENIVKQKETLGHLLFMTTMLKNKKTEPDFMFNDNYDAIEEDIKKMENKISSILSDLNYHKAFVEEEFKKYINLVEQRKEIENQIFSSDN